MHGAQCATCMVNGSARPRTPTGCEIQVNLNSRPRKLRVKIV